MDEKLWCVYKHTNKANGKSYVGRCRWPNYNARWANGNGYKKAPLFWPEIVKYGWDGFTHEILYSGLSIKRANDLEKAVISSLKTNDPEHGYNICCGGAGFTAHHTESTRSRISNSLKKYVMTGSHRKHISESIFGTKHPQAKPVLQFTKDGVFVKEWGCAMDACRALGIPKPNLSACCLGKRTSAGGYKWAFERR